VILHLLTLPILSSSENARQRCFIHTKTISYFFHSLDKKHSIKLNESTAQAPNVLVLIWDGDSSYDLKCFLLRIASK